MQVVELRCPHCSTKLRLRDKSFVGRTIHCPDCAQRVAIVRTAAGQIEGKPPDPKRSQRKAGNPGAATTSDDASAHNTDDEAPPPPPPTTAPASRWIAIATAAVLGIGVLVFSLLTGDDGTESVATAPEGNPEEPPATRPEANEQGVEPPNLADNSDDSSDEAKAERHAIGSLAEWVVAYRQRHGHFPATNPLARNLPTAQRLGWLAQLAASQDPNGPQPLWDRPLDDPLNSRFVRRRMDAFLNPLEARAAADGFPATHYVGVAGVGPDAAQLPKTHPRAGIFGIGRQTTVDDVADGLSNTLLIVGIADHPVPWAADGDRTIRPFTQEPYVNGPDQFGTGQPDGMFVAMADGSVRFVSRDMSGVVWRRMAAMADGLPLDSNIPGEPGASPGEPLVTDAASAPAPTTDPPAIVAVDPDKTPSVDQPIEPRVARDPVAVPPPNYDVEGALSQPIVRFSQVRGVPFADLLPQLQDLAGVPVQFTSDDDARREAVLTREVSVELRDTTVGEILDAVLKQVGLQSETGREFGIRLLIPTGV